MLSAVVKLLEKKYNVTTLGVVAKPEEPQDDEEEDGEEKDDITSLLLNMYLPCMELLNVSTQHSIKLIRDMIKKAWGSLFQYISATPEFMDVLLGSVAGEEDEDEDGEEGQDAGQEEDGEDDGDIEEGDVDVDVDVDGEEEDDEIPLKSNRKRPRQKISKVSKDEESKDSEGEEEEEFINEEKLMKLLKAKGNIDEGSKDNGNGNDDDDDEDESDGGSEMGEGDEADKALSQMIQMRKQSRKQAMLEGKRIEYISRCRGLDMIEVCIYCIHNCMRCV